MKNFEPTHITSKGILVQSIPYFATELEKLNSQISDIITAIETAKDEERRRFLLKMGESNHTLSSMASKSERNLTNNTFLQPINDNEDEEKDSLLEDNQINLLSSVVETPLKPFPHFEQDETLSNLPVEEVVTPNSESDEHRRDISELSVHFSEAIVADSTYAENCGQRTLQSIDEDEGGNISPDANGSNSMDFTQEKNSEEEYDVTLTETSHRSLEEIIRSFDDDPNEAVIHETVDLPINLSDFQNDPFYQLFFSDIVDKKEESGLPSLPAKERNVDRGSFLLHLNKDSSQMSLIIDDDDDDDVSSVCIAKADITEDIVDENQTCQSSPLLASDDDGKSSIGDENETNVKQDSHTPELNKTLLMLSSELNNTNDDANSMYILNADSNQSLISDLRRELRKESSCRSLFSDTSLDSNDVKVVVDASFLQKNPMNRDQSHNRNVTFNSIRTTMSSASKKTKGSIQKSILKTSDGVKKSVNVIHGGVKKSANMVHGTVKNSATIVHGGMKKTVYVVQDGMKKTVYIVQDGAKKSATAMQDGVKKSVSGMKQVGAKSVRLATDLIRGSEDGRVRDGGFVTFTSLTAKVQCVQMMHHETPFTFHVMDAPQPKDIFWNNVGLAHHTQQIGFLVAQLLTAALCLFWTIPVTFVSSLSEVDSLKRAIPSLENVIENNPWIQPMLAQLNPILIVLLKMMLPVILQKICEREGHISTTALNASLLTKLALFLVRRCVFRIHYSFFQ